MVTRHKRRATPHKAGRRFRRVEAVFSNETLIFTYEYRTEQIGIDDTLKERDIHRNKQIILNVQCAIPARISPSSPLLPLPTFALILASLNDFLTLYKSALPRALLELFHMSFFSGGLVLELFLRLLFLLGNITKSVIEALDLGLL
jgi:hypothetical protein